MLKIVPNFINLDGRHSGIESERHLSGAPGQARRFSLLQATGYASSRTSGVNIILVVVDWAAWHHQAKLLHGY